MNLIKKTATIALGMTFLVTAFVQVNSQPAYAVGSCFAGIDCEEVCYCQSSGRIGFAFDCAVTNCEL